MPARDVPDGRHHQPDREPVGERLTDDVGPQQRRPGAEEDQRERAEELGHELALTVVHHRPLLVL